MVVHEPGSMPLPATEAMSIAAQLDTELALSLVSACEELGVDDA